MTTLSPTNDYLDVFGDSAAESGREQECARIYVHRFGDHLWPSSLPCTPLAQTGSILFLSVNPEAVIKRSICVMFWHSKSVFFCSRTQKGIRACRWLPSPWSFRHQNFSTCRVPWGLSITHPTGRRGTSVEGALCAHASFIKSLGPAATHITSSHILLVRASHMTTNEYKVGWEILFIWATSFQLSIFLWKWRADHNASWTLSLSPLLKGFWEFLDVIHPSKLSQEPLLQSCW